MNSLKSRIFPISLLVVSTIFIAYIACSKFRDYISNQNIDSNFILGLIALFTLIVSMSQGSKDRKMTYNMNNLNALRNNGLEIISKLVTIRTKGNVILATLKSYRNAIKNGVIFIDANNTLSKADIDEGFQIITAYADTYFQDECVGWNEMLDKISEIATDNFNVAQNYEANLQLIQNGTAFTNPTLDRLDEIIDKDEKLNKEIEEITVNMRNRIIEKINLISTQIKQKL